MAEGISRSLLGVCHLLMAALFALSTTFQFNDSDWYLWIPLYAAACAVNLVNWASPNWRPRKLGKFTFWLGVLLFIKVGVEGFVHETAGFWSLDMRERVVRERFGSGLVVGSMYLPGLDYSVRITKYRLPALVGTAYGLSFLFFMFQHDEMRY